MNIQEVIDYVSSRRNKHLIALKRCEAKPNCPAEEINSLFKKVDMCDVIIEALEKRGEI